MFSNKKTPKKPSLLLPLILLITLLGLGQDGWNSPCKSLTFNPINQSQAAPRGHSATPRVTIFPLFWERCGKETAPPEEFRAEVLTDIKILSTKYHAPSFQPHRVCKNKRFRCLLTSSFYYFIVLLSFTCLVVLPSPCKAAKPSSRLAQHM